MSCVLLHSSYYIFGLYCACNNIGNQISIDVFVRGNSVISTYHSIYTSPNHISTYAADSILSVIECKRPTEKQHVRLIGLYKKIVMPCMPPSLTHDVKVINFSHNMLVYRNLEVDLFFVPYQPTRLYAPCIIHVVTSANYNWEQSVPK